MHPTPPAPGEKLGRFTLGRVLGQGGFAWVYEAVDPAGKPFAIKILKPRYTGVPEFAPRFRREGELAQGLNHPNIVRIEEVGEDGGHLYFAMDVYPDTLAARHHLSEELALRLAGIGPLTDALVS